MSRTLEELETHRDAAHNGHALKLRVVRESVARSADEVKTALAALPADNIVSAPNASCVVAQNNKPVNTNG